NHNRHQNKKVKTSGGRSTDKTPVVGLLSRDGKVRTFVVGSVGTTVLHPIMLANVDKDALLITDAYTGYSGIEEHYHNHVMVKSQKDSYKTDSFIHTNGIENFWSIFKRGIIGIYHFVSKKHLQRYTNEFSYRYNNRLDAG